MNLFEFELLKLRRNHYFNAFFLLSAILIFAVAMSFSSENLANYSVGIGYIDRDNSQDSAAYIEALKKKEILDLVEVKDEKEGMDKLSHSIMEGMLIIPKGYFANILDYKLEYRYLEYNVIAPALVDLLAEDLMLPVSRSKLLNATKIYLSEDWQDSALHHYEDLLHKNSFYLDSTLQSISNSNGLKSDYEAKKIEHGRNIYGYALVICIFTLVFSLCLSGLKHSHIEERKKTIHGLYFRSFVWQRVFDYVKLSVLWICLCMVVDYHVGFKWENLSLHIVFGLLILFLYYEAICVIYRLFHKSHIGNLIAIGFIMLSSIFGGAYFPTDLFPKFYHFLLSWIPFYQFNTLYYAGISGKMDSMTGIYIIIYCILLFAFLFVNYRRNEMDR